MSDDCGIYQITNKINNKMYIGKSIHLQRRWLEHKSKYSDIKNTNNLYKAMREYGVENFVFTIIEICPVNNLILNEREKYWIKYYQTYENGYNETRGGDGLFQYDADEIRKLWDLGFCSKEIQNILGCKDKTVHLALENYKDYTPITSAQRGNQSTSKKEKARINALQRFGTGPVYQYSLEGEFLQDFPSMADAVKSLGKKKDHSIYKAILYPDRSNKAYGFLWSKEKLEKIPPYKQKNSCYVRNIETQKIFTSLRQAAKWAQCVHDTIKHACETGSSAGHHPETQEILHWEFIT